MEGHYQYIQEQITSRNNFFLINYNIINPVFDVISYYFLSTCFCLSFSVCMFSLFSLYIFITGLMAVIPAY
jgi:hypothetical protein